MIKFEEKSKLTKKIKKDHPWDVVVVGGGPAGMIAAGRAAVMGCHVLLLEKNPSLGKKLLITGGGRCNVMNNTLDVRTLLTSYKDAGKFLFSAFAKFGVPETRKFFEERGMPMVEENAGRMFPVSNTARSVWNVLNEYMENGRVTVRTAVPVRSITHDAGSAVFHVVLSGGDTVAARRVIVATGGLSRPDTGSTGDGFRWLSRLGHTVLPNSGALVPIALGDTWIEGCAGLTLSDAKITIMQSEKRLRTLRGKVLFTHVGLSGPTILNMSSTIGELLQHGPVFLRLDLFPDKDSVRVREDLHNILTAESNKKIKNVLSALIPPKLVAPLLFIAGVDGETPCHSVRSAERMRLVTFMRALPLSVRALLGKEKAIVSSGGIPLTEIDPRTMESRYVPGLYITGDLLHIDRPSGGYSLQLCWTTGYVAGSSAAEKENIVV